MKYSHAAVAGTFDRLHIGQKKLLDEALKHSKRLSVGITTNEFVKGKLLSQTIQDFDTRKNQVEEFINDQKSDCQVDFFLLTDIYGTALTDETLEALFVTPATLENAEKVNNKRQEKGLSKLDIITAPLVKSSDDQVISSERIRMGEIDRRGFVYTDLFRGKTKLVMPEELRARLREPLGQVIGHPEKLDETVDSAVNALKKLNPVLTISVGDIISRTLVQSSYIPNLQILDFKSRREILEDIDLTRLRSKKRLVNDPGTVATVVVNYIAKTINDVVKNNAKKLIVINGEEDLTALPSILLAPLGSAVLYGHFQLGVILVEVTEEKKDEVKKILLQFTM